MTEFINGFMNRFLLCSLLLCGIIGIFFGIRRLLGRLLGAHLQYRLWLLLLILLAVPFLPQSSFPILADPTRISPEISSSISGLQKTKADTTVVSASVWMKDFTESVSKSTPAFLWKFLFIIWTTGAILALLSGIRSALKLRTLHSSALPLQHPKARELFKSCLDTLHIQRPVAVYSTAFLRSPVMTGVLRPRIYLPIRLLSNYHEEDLRYILLHELTHYRHLDAITGYLMNLAGTLYWFHPLVWVSLRAMRTDRELACDARVLSVLEETAYEDYGLTLLRFAQGSSLPFAAGLGQKGPQIRTRIQHIASYRKPSFSIRLRSVCICFLIVPVFMACVPLLSFASASLSPNAIDTGRKSTSATPSSGWDSSISPGKHSDSDGGFSAYFTGYDGSFVLYDSETDGWTVYNETLARTRVSPDSTYKIYDALFALEEGLITPEHSALSWSGTRYPFDEWNRDQTLSSALTCSVNWYFQALDQQMGKSTLRSWLQRIEYGNEALQGNLDSYWMESSLLISPLEQVELLTGFYHNEWNLHPEYVKAVKNAICLASSSDGSLYGKTGTGQVNGENRNGWFIGFVESSGHTVFFAMNLTGEGACGSEAASRTLAILSDRGIYTDPSL